MQDMQVQTLKETTGTIYIRSNPVAAEVLIDGEYYGQTPLRINNAEPGTYTCTVKAQGYNDYNGRLLVEAGDTVPEFVILSKAGCAPCSAKKFGQMGQEFQQMGQQFQQTGQPIGIQSLQSPTPIPGYMIVQERTVVYILGFALIAVLAYAFLSKK